MSQSVIGCTHITLEVWLVVWVCGLSQSEPVMRPDERRMEGMGGRGGVGWEGACNNLPLLDMSILHTHTLEDV